MVRATQPRATPLDQDTILAEIWNQPISAILESLGATVAGLSRAEVDARRRQYGLNQPLAHRRRPLWLQFLTRFLNPLVLILLFASALSAAAGNVTSFVIVIVDGRCLVSPWTSSRKCGPKTPSRLCAAPSPCASRSVATAWSSSEPVDPAGTRATWSVWRRRSGAG